MSPISALLRASLFLAASVFTLPALAAPVIVTDSAGNSFQLYDDGTYGVIVLDADGVAYSLSPDGRWKKLDEAEAAKLPPQAAPGAPTAEATPNAAAPAIAQAPADRNDDLVTADPPTAPKPPIVAEAEPPAVAEAEPPASSRSPVTEPADEAPEAAGATVDDAAIEGKVAAFIKRETGIDDDAEADQIAACVMKDMASLDARDRKRLVEAEDFESGFFGGVAADKPAMAEKMESTIEGCLNG